MSERRAIFNIPALGDERPSQIMDRMLHLLGGCECGILFRKYEGQLMSDGGAYSSLRSILLVLTHDYIITCVHGPTGGNGHERKDADAALRTILMPFEAKGVLYAWGPVQPANGPPTRTTSG